MQADADVLQERQRMTDEWRHFLERRKDYIQLLHDFKASMYGERFAEKPFTIETVTVEQVVDVKEEPYKP